MGEQVKGWTPISDTHAVRVRIYPPMPQCEAVIMRLMRISLPMNIDSVVERWNFKDMCWTRLDNNAVLSTEDGPCLALPPLIAETFALELLRATVGMNT